MNQPVHLREREVREANRRVHQASGARAHGPSPGGCYDRCCWIFCSNIGFGYAPTSVSTCRPSLKNRILGIERTLKRIAVFWLPATSTLVTFNFPAYSPATLPRTRLPMRHGP